MYLIENDTRKPVEWLTYCAETLPDPQQPMGPKYRSREVLWPVTAEYDPESGCTRVGLSYLPPERAQS